jgi:hypothetical protein
VTPAALVIVLAVLALAIPAFVRANEVAAISVRSAEILLVRGSLPAPLVDDIADVVRRANVARATIRVVKEGGRARAIATGVDEPTAQRLRNVLGAHPYKLVVSAPRARGPRNLGQVLGIEWLAWRLSGRTPR